MLFDNHQIIDTYHLINSMTSNNLAFVNDFLNLQTIQVENLELFLNQLHSIPQNLQIKSDISNKIYSRRCTKDLVNAIHKILLKLHCIYCDGNLPLTHTILQSMHELNWHNLYQKEFSRTILKLIEEKVRNEISGSYDTSFKDELCSWIEEEFMPFVLKLFNNDINAISKYNLQLETLKSVLLFKCICKVRSTEMFEIVAEFPDSIQCLYELNELAFKSDMLGDIGKTFRDIVYKRLLHLGASTNQILDMYVSMIKALRILDSSDLVLNHVAAPVRKYLIGRKDTVRCIVASLTESKSSDLHTELKSGGLLEYAADEDDEENGPGENWMPTRRDKDLSSASTLKGLDVLALMVSIYGSTDVFISEYRALLADKLISNIQFSKLDEEIAMLELLKIRFGEESLHNCEVMLHDMQESKRTNNFISNTCLKNKMIQFPVEYAIVSSNYWPKLRESSDMKFHDSIQYSLKYYEDEYADVKKPRKIHPISSLGVVELELEFSNGTLRNFLTNPIQANVIAFISENNRTTIDNISSCLDLTDEEIESTIRFWISRRVLRQCQVESSPILDPFGSEVYEYEIIEEQDHIIEEQLKSNTVYNQISSTLSADFEEKIDLSKLEIYLLGILGNQGPMSIERIHTMMKHLAAGSNEFHFDMNLVPFRSYLQSLIEQNKIEFIDGQYQRVTK